MTWDYYGEGEYELLYRQLRDLIYPTGKKEVKE